SRVDVAAPALAAVAVGEAGLAACDPAGHEGARPAAAQATGLDNGDAPTERVDGWRPPISGPNRSRAEPAPGRSPGIRTGETGVDDAEGGSHRERQENQPPLPGTNPH